MTDDEEKNPLLTRDEAAAFLGKKPTWLRDHHAEVPHIKIGRDVRYTRPLLEEYLEANTIRPTASKRSARSKKR